MKYTSLLVALFICTACQTEKKQNDVAVMFRGDATHSARYSNPAIRTLHETKWKTKLEGKLSCKWI